MSGGKRPFADVLRAGSMQQPPFAERTLRKVKKDLEFISVRKGFGRTALFYWRDPSVPEAEPATDPTMSNAAILSALHELKEEKRLSVPPVASSPAVGHGSFSQRKGIAINYDDPNDPGVLRMREMHASAQAQQLVDARMEEVRGVIHNSDPLNFLLSVNDHHEIDEMKRVVHEHLAELGRRSQGAPKYKKVRQVTTLSTRTVPEMSSVNGVPTPTGKTYNEVQEKITVVDDEHGDVSVPDGYEPGEDVGAEIVRWNAWIVQARARAKQLYLVRETGA